MILTPKQGKRKLKKMHRAEKLKGIKPCKVCGSLRHRAPSRFCRRWVIDQRRLGKLGPFPR
jgi:recombinational DNA repair protein RecR